MGDGSIFVTLHDGASLHACLLKSHCESIICRLSQVQEQLAAAQAECAKLKYEASVATGKAQTMTERMARWV
jgi:hypothetical protein